MTENVLDALETVIVLSHMPGIVHILMYQSYLILISRLEDVVPDKFLPIGDELIDFVRNNNGTIA